MRHATKVFCIVKSPQVIIGWKLIIKAPLPEFPLVFETNHMDLLYKATNKLDGNQEQKDIK
jgi:hypothetical protein